MTCHRLEQDDLLGDLGEPLDDHVEQCPDCSARAQGYRRIAGWIADGRTPHRPSADWRRRTLAHVLASQDPLRPIPAIASGPAAAFAPDAAADHPAKLPEAALSESAATRARAASSLRRRGSRAVLAIASAAIAGVVVWVAWLSLRSDPQQPRVAIQRSGSATGSFSFTPLPESAAGPHAPESLERVDPRSSTAPVEAPAPAGARSTAEDGARPPKRTTPPRRPGDSQQQPEPVARSTKRGGAVVVDWPPESPDVSRPPGDAIAIDSRGRVTFASPTGDFGGLTADEIRRVVEARAGVFRLCYQRELEHTPGIHGKLLVHIHIGSDGRVQAADTALPGSTLHSDAVAQCVMGEVERLRFPAKDEIADVNYAFEFTQAN